jgi:hypothetical protein
MPEEAQAKLAEEATELVAKCRRLLDSAETSLNDPDLEPADRVILAGVSLGSVALSCDEYAGKVAKAMDNKEV